MNENLNISRVQWPDMHYSFTCRLKVKPINFIKGSTCWALQFDKLKYTILRIYSKTNKWHDEINDRMNEHEESKRGTERTITVSVWCSGWSKINSYTLEIYWPHTRRCISLFSTVRFSSSHLLIIHSWNEINFRKWAITNIFNFSFTCHF